MKKILTLCLLMATVFALKGQNKITGTKDDFPRGIPYFDKVNFEITYQVVEDRGTIRVNLSNPKIFVHPDSKYNYQGKFYSRQDLGLANWPQTQKPINFGVYLSVQYPGGSVNHMFSCYDGICKDNNDYILASNANKNNHKPADFQVSYNGMMTYNGQGNDQVERLIVAKIANANASKTTAQNAGPNNHLGTSTTTQTTSQIPSLESQYDKIGIPANTPTYTKKEVTTQAGSLVGELLNDWNAASERKQQRRDAENNEKWDRIHQRARNRFEFYYDKLIDLANNGDENAQVILYLESDGEYGNHLAKAVPLREEWYKKALENKNQIALLAKINSSKYEKNTELLHKLADTGNVDAMVMLGLWYSQKPNKESYFYTRNIYGTTHGYMKGGGNKELAMKYLTMAAEKGSPNAMNYLGLIYRDGKISEIYYPLKLKIEKNEKLAFEWFSKSIIPEYKESLYQAHHLTNLFYRGSTFIGDSYFTLAYMYEKGKGVPKDVAKAAELRRLGKERYEYIRKSRGFIE